MSGDHVTVKSDLKIAIGAYLCTAVLIAQRNIWYQNFTSTIVRVGAFELSCVMKS